jgi:YVTN family beta-propeller protein
VPAWGGGTFDAAVLRKSAVGFELLGVPEGIERLGGIDFDEAVVGHVLGFLGAAVGGLDVSDPVVVAALARLRADCVAAKEALSADTEVSIPVLLPSVQTEIRLTRSEFESMIRPPLAETTAVLGRALVAAGVSAGELAAVLLVGGSSRIPLVGQLVAAELGRPVAIDVHPKHAVAEGAALAAGRLLGVTDPLPPAKAEPPVVVTTDRRTSSSGSDSSPTAAPSNRAAGVVAGEPPDSPSASASAPTGLGGPATILDAGGVAATGVGGAAGGAAATGIGGADGGPDASRTEDTGREAALAAELAASSGSSAPASVEPSSVGVTSGRVGREPAAGAPVTATPTPLSVPPVPPVPPGSPGSPAADRLPDAPPRGGSRKTLLLIGAVVAVVAVVALVAALLPRKKHSSSPPQHPPQVPTFQVQQNATSIAAGGGSLWLGGSSSPTVSRFDPVSHQLTQVIRAGNDDGDTWVAFGAGAVWAVNEGGTNAYRIDPSTNSVTATYAVGRKPRGVIFAAGAVWVAASMDGLITRIDPTTGVITQVHLRGEPNHLAYSTDTLWVTDPANSDVARIDTVKNVPLGDVKSGGCPDFLAADDTAVWVQDECKVSSIFKVDPTSGNVVGTAAVGRDAKGLVLAGGSLYVSNATDGTVSQVDVATLKTTRVIVVGNGPAPMVIDGDALWVMNTSDSTLSRIAL